MIEAMLLDALAIAMLVLLVAIAVILVRRYLRTREIGFIWLGAAVVVWPLVSRLLETGERVSIDRALHHQSVIYPFSMVESGQISIGSLLASLAISQQLIGVCLLLIAVLYLAKLKSSHQATA
jgi:hypothetical protein